MRSLGPLVLLLMYSAHLPGQTPCSGGSAGGYPCDRVDLMSFVPKALLGSGNLNDCWGWTDPVSGHEYALVGMTSGTAFVDITDPVAPVRIGNLPTHTTTSSWRDIKVHDGFAFIVSEAGGHGMQVFDLGRLDTVTTPPVTFTEDAHFALLSNAHNIVIDEESAMAYAVGSNLCSGGLAIIDIQDPLTPAYIGCFSQDGYTHDAQCVVYHGPDGQYSGKRVCFCSNEDTFTIVDVDDPTDASQISRTGYTGSRYTHQGWLSEDHHYFFLGDELDESNFGHHTRTRVWDVSDLANPVLLGYHDGSTTAIDHNLYTHLNLVFQANYRAGLQILDILDPEDPSTGLTQLGYFDTYPANNATGYNGAWSVYPYFPSGNVIVSSIGEGLFVLRPPQISRIKLKVILQGPYENGTGLMRDDLRVQGALPLTEPYSGLGYTHVGGGGGESTSAGVLTNSGPDAIVDWVVVELRSTDAPATILATKSGLLQRDGDVVNPDGSGSIDFPVPMGLYHIAVRHRNHLGVMSAEPLPLGPTERVYDLTDGSVALYGVQPVAIVDGRQALWAGNVSGDDAVKYTGAGNDRDPILVAVGSTTPNQVVTGTYSTRDVDLDGEVKYTGSGNDRDPILINTGGTTPNNVRMEQLP